LLYLGGVLLIYTHRCLFSISGSWLTGGVFVCGGLGVCVGVLVVVYCVGLVYYWVVGCIACGCLSVVNCFITVYDMFLIVLFYILSAAYCVSCDSFRKAVPD
jgi:hypothetical protein